MSRRIRSRFDTRCGPAFAYQPRYAAAAAVLLSVTLLSPTAGSYPLDGYERTDIGRLEAARRIEEGLLSGSRQPPGALLSTGQVHLRLAGRREWDLPEPDPEFSRQIAGLLEDEPDRYSLAVLDLSDPERPRYAEHRAEALYNPGSVGKILVALAWFQLLAERYPDDVDARLRLLRETEVTADDFIVSDHHTVRAWDRTSERLVRRPLEQGDRGNLMEFMDWMMSASANAAASVLMREAVLLRQFGADYPLPHDAGRRFFLESPKPELNRLLAEVMHDPLTENGFDPGRIRQGSLFTATGKRHVPGTSSHASARELMRFLLKMEQGRLVDDFSSLELKRLLYVTERRIRYASAPALNDAAVYFKSGSLFQCKPEPDFICRKYQGNVRNLMNSVAIVESPAGEPRLHYLVALMSDVLRKNSAVDHQSLATRIHRLIQKLHEQKEDEAEVSGLMPP